MTHVKPVSPASAAHTLSARLAPRALLVMSLVLAMTSIGLAGSASAKSRRSAVGHQTLTLRTKFTRFGSGELIGDGRYVLVYGNNKGVLVNGSTGRRATISVPGCSNADAIGGASIVFTCSQGTGSSYDLYNITTRQLQPLALNPSITAGCTDDIISCVSVTAVGADWVAFTSACQMEHCEKTFVFQNLATGEMAADPSSQTSTFDLDSPALSRSLCTPVTVPSTNVGSEAYEPGWGSVLIDGRFAIANSDGGSYLEQCGSGLHEFLTHTSYPGCAHETCAPPVNSHAIIWESKPRRLSGIFLPSRQRLTTPVPSKVDPTPGMYVNGDQYSLALTPHTLYVGNGGTVWTTPIPTAPPCAKRSRH